MHDAQDEPLFAERVAGLDTAKSEVEMPVMHAAPHGQGVTVAHVLPTGSGCAVQNNVSPDTATPVRGGSS